MGHTNALDLHTMRNVNPWGQPFLQMKASVFFTLFAPMLRSPGWPGAYEQYRDGIVVMNPYNASAADVREVKRALNATVIMYFDSGDIQIKVDNGLCPFGCFPHANCSTAAMPCCTDIDCNAALPTTPLCSAADPFTVGLGRAFKPQWSLRTLGVKGQPSQPVCTYSKGPLYIPFAEELDALVPFLSAWIQERDFDGIYLDEASVPAHTYLLF